MVQQNSALYLLVAVVMVELAPTLMLHLAVLEQMVAVVVAVVAALQGKVALLAALGRHYLVVELHQQVALLVIHQALVHQEQVELAVQVEAAAEPVMQVRSADPLALLQAVYHLGNRHVAMELHADRLVLLQDSVLADLLRQRGLAVELAELPFQPEAGAYEGLGHHHHGHHDHGHSHP